MTSRATPSPLTPLPHRGRGGPTGRKHLVRQAASRNTRKAVVTASRALRPRQTLSESLLWQALRNRKLCGAKFRRQARVGHYIVDFYCAPHGLIIEVDGAIHARQRTDDEHRQRTLEAAGLRVIRVAAAACEQDLAGVLELIRRELPRIASSPLPQRGRGVGGEGAP